MVFDPTQFPRVLTIYLELSNYPTLAPLIRERMRVEMFKRRVISPKAFESEVQEKAVQSQEREGIVSPMTEEPPDIWVNRLAIIRDHLTDFYFAYNLPHDLFETLLREVLEKRMPAQDVVLTFHPELAPWDILFAQGEAYEHLSAEELRPVKHHLQEIKVVLIKAMISDHLEYVGIAKEWFDISDLQAIRSQRFGRGKIGGKAAGVMLAETILRKSNRPELSERIHIPKSWFLGADVFYQFTQLNELLEYSNQKYRSEQEVREEYSSICEFFNQGTFPEPIIAGLRSILEELGDLPLIVRSSSLLEDSFGTSFAGKYESHFCPNQGTPNENLKVLIDAIRSVYASVYSPDVILYRRRMGLLDYDERMAVLIQEVKGQRQGEFFFPDGAGVGFSQNQFRWDPRIDRDSGILRLVWGLGTRAVDRLSADYPRLVALSHPDFRPEVDPGRIKRYSQHFVDLLHLEDNTFTTLPLGDVVKGTTPSLRLIAQQFHDGHFSDYVGLPVQFDSRDVVLTFDGLLRNTDFPELMREMLQSLEVAYKRPVDTEFVVDLSQQVNGTSKPIIHLLQCRPQSHLPIEITELPDDIPEDERVFSVQGLVSDGLVSKIRYVIYVNGESYYDLDPIDQKQIARLIGQLNGHLEEERFILIGPGRWGSINSEMGVSVTYADLYNARALIEVVSDKAAIEPSYGTHFFQDLVEARIFILAIAVDDPHTELNLAFFLDTHNSLEEILPDGEKWADIVKVIDIPSTTDGSHLELVMNGEAGRAIAYIKAYSQ
jgi:hypothetical protein